MNIVYLRYAVAVAKAGSLNKAAEELFIAQPNLSRAIKELEKELGIVIFDRNSKGITLTSDGERLISYGKKIIRQIDSIEEEFKEKKYTTVFSLSAPRVSYISHAFAQFSKHLTETDRCEVYYKETNNMRAITNILEKDYKLGIVRYAAVYDKQFRDMAESKNLNYEMIAEFGYVLLMNKNCPLAKKDDVTFADLEGYIQIAHADPYVPSVSLSEIKKEELPDDVDRRIFVFERASQFDVLAENENAYIWVSPVPDDISERYGLTMRKCADNTKVYKDVLIYKKDYTLTKTDKAFITELNDAKRKYLK